MPEQKAEIVHKQEHISVRALEKMYQADWSMICRWVKNYIAEGEASFVHKWHPGNPFAALHTLLVVPPPRPAWLSRMFGYRFHHTCIPSPRNHLFLLSLAHARRTLMAALHCHPPHVLSDRCCYTQIRFVAHLLVLSASVDDPTPNRFPVTLYSMMITWGQK